MKITIEDVKRMAFADVVALCALQIGKRANMEIKRTQLSVLCVSQFLQGRALTADEIRTATNEDAGRLINHIRTTLHIPIHRPKGSPPVYSMLPVEIERFLNDDTRPAQALQTRDDAVKHAARRDARKTIKLLTALGEPVPNSVRQIAAAKIPTRKQGSRDHAN